MLEKVHTHFRIALYAVVIAKLLVGMVHGVDAAPFLHALSEHVVYATLVD